MSYRFVKVTTYYDSYLRDYYQRYPRVVSKSYSEQMAHIMEDAFGWADFFATHLKELGVDAHEIIANAEPLQQAWAREHGLKAVGKDLVIAQLQTLRPDVVMFEDSFRFNGAWITHLREQIPSIKQVIGSHCAPFTEELIRQFKVFDYMLTCSPVFSPVFARHGIRMYQIYHAFEASLLPRISQDNRYPEIDFIFLGSLVTTKGFHNTRIQVIEALLEAGIDLQVYTVLQQIGTLRLLAIQGAYIGAAVLKKIGLEGAARYVPGVKKAISLEEFPVKPRYPHLIREVVRAPIYGLEMFKALSRARIGFNIHIDAAGRYAANMRLFEVTGVGTCLVTDWKENLHELFEPDKEIVTYRSAEECVEKVEWLIEHPKEREEIAMAGQARCLRDHNFAKRAQQLDGIIKREMS